MGVEKILEATTKGKEVKYVTNGGSTKFARNDYCQKKRNPKACKDCINILC